MRELTSRFDKTQDRLKTIFRCKEPEEMLEILLRQEKFVLEEWKRSGSDFASRSLIDPGMSLLVFFHALTIAMLIPTDLIRRLRLRSRPTTTNLL